MAWIECAKSRRELKRDKRWLTGPCLVIRRTTLTLNLLVLEACGNPVKLVMRVYYDKEQSLLGFRCVHPPDDAEGYVFCRTGKRATARTCTCRHIMRLLQPWVGCICPLSQQDGMLVATLPEPQGDAEANGAGS